MKEYGIYQRQGNGTPYMIHFFNDVVSAKLKLYEMIQLEEERQRPYFVDNDFFDNKYAMVGKLKYFCIKERETTEWINYEERKTKDINTNKIIFLNNYKNVLTM